MKKKLYWEIVTGTSVGMYSEIGCFENGDWRLTMHHGDRYYAIMYMPQKRYNPEDPDGPGIPYTMTKVYAADTLAGIQALRDSFAEYVAKKLSAAQMPA